MQFQERRGAPRRARRCVQSVTRGTGSATSVEESQGAGLSLGATLVVVLQRGGIFSTQSEIGLFPVGEGSLYAPYNKILANSIRCSMEFWPRAAEFSVTPMHAVGSVQDH